MKRIIVCLAMLTLGWLAPRMVAAECCDHCGCQCQCCKVCRLVPDVKKITKVKYDCECEDICIPGPSCIIGYQCAADDDCQCGQHKHPEPIWQSSCGRVKTRRKLVRVETTKEVKTFKCVVVHVCPQCNAQSETLDKAAANVCARERGEPVIYGASTPAETALAQASEPQPELAAHEEAGEDVQLASHESKSPSLVDRLKRSFQPILGK